MRAVIAGLLLCGCNPVNPYDPDLSQSEFLCESEGAEQCPPGFSCNPQPTGPDKCERDSGPTGEPGIRIVEPTKGAELDASRFDLVVEIENFTLQSDLRAEPVEGEGHWHWYFDGLYRSTVTELSTSAGPEEPGCHVISVDLRQTDHAPLDPPRGDEVSVRLEDGGPTVCILAPPDGESFTEGEIAVTVDIRNFILDDSEEDGHGHWHVSIDGEPTDDHLRSASAPVLVAAGEERTLTVELVANDESPLDPRRFAVVTVNVVPR